PAFVRVLSTTGTQKINLPLTIASNTTFNVAGSSTLKISDPMTINTGMTVTQTGTGSVSYESSVNLGTSAGIPFRNNSHTNARNLGSASSATLTTGGNKTLKIDGLSMNATSKFDLNDNDLIVSGGMTKQQITDSIRTARAGGAWTGNGITSTAAKNQANHNTT